MVAIVPSEWMCHATHVLQCDTDQYDTLIRVRITNTVGGSTGNVLNAGTRNLSTGFGDVRFTLDDGEILPCFIETLDTTYADYIIYVSTVVAPTSTLHVYYGRTDQLAPTDTYIWVIMSDEFDDNEFNTGLWTGSWVVETDTGRLAFDIENYTGAWIQSNDWMSGNQQILFAIEDSQATILRCKFAMQDSANYYYVFYSGGSWTLYKVVSGSASTIDTASAPVMTGNHNLSISLISGTIKVYVDEQEIMSATDYAYDGGRFYFLAYGPMYDFALSLERVQVSKTITESVTHGVWSGDVFGSRSGITCGGMKL